ncbi:MAG: hotdog fold thioesterase [Calditrichaeota bacterium]|nr:hotdog fold thioesterase [Calditrichota bacterium]
MTKQELAEKSVHFLYDNDPFSQWLGIELDEIRAGYVKIHMTIRKEMLNGFGLCHGGVTFSLADSALAFACNSHGSLSMLLDASVSYPERVLEGDRLTAVAEEHALKNKTGLYVIKVTKNNNITVAIFKATVYRTGKKHFNEIETED